MNLKREIEIERFRKSVDLGLVTKRINTDKNLITTLQRFLNPLLFIPTL